MTAGGGRLLIHFNDIVANARSHNSGANISGFLMFDRHRFHQILEGPAEKIDILFAKIAVDQRHRNVEQLAREDLKDRDFTEWSMASFISSTGKHPLVQRHQISSGIALSAERLLAFAKDFVRQDDSEAE
jgi:hypothetical protein